MTRYEEIRLRGNSAVIYTGPGREYVSGGSVYSEVPVEIVEKRKDKNENTWGRLRSGAGWIMLDQEG